MYQIASILLVLLLLPAWPAFSASGTDETELQSTGEDIQNIDVVGRRPEVLRLKMEKFIVEIGAPVQSRGYARWRDPLCVGVYNLPNQTMAQYIAEKISLVALDNGLKSGSPGCEPNLHIVFSPDARELAGNLAENSPRLFFPFGNAESTTQGQGALERFRTSEAPVRWWQITMVVDEWGGAATVLPGINDVALDNTNVPAGQWTVPYTRGAVSRLKSGVSDDILAGLIIVDAGKLANVEWPQLSDYLAMVSLAQIAPNNRASGEDSILNLFNTDNPPPGMTEMDRIYLRSLYEMDTMTMPHTQRGIFSNRMVRVLRDMENGE